MTYADDTSTHGAADPETHDGDTRRERHETTGDRLLETVKRIVREGNARRITIRNQDEEVILTFPLSAGVVGAALLPVWAGVGAMAALLGNCSIEVERRPDAPAPEDEPGL
jgi:hypothetical protein